MKKFFLVILIALLYANVWAMQYDNTYCLFSFDLPDTCKVYTFLETDSVSRYVVYNAKTGKSLVNIFHRRVSKNMVVRYSTLLKNIKKQNDSSILHSEPFYNLLRQEMEIIHQTMDGQSYEKILLKAQSTIHITSAYPLSAEAQRIINTFDNHTTFKGNLYRMRSNAGGLVMSIVLTLLLFLGYRSRDYKGKWIYRVCSLVLFGLVALCTFADLSVMCFCLGVCALLWLVMFSHAKWLIWLIDAILG